MTRVSTGLRYYSYSKLEQTPFPLVWFFLFGEGQIINSLCFMMILC
uniref:Uncharacterized protein n=1 Tax=Rhizophora mucronata TaxID=61149 RepID=A0A2P2PF41_RHIMU